MAPRKSSKATLKYLAACKDPKIITEILRKADKQVVKAICNAAFNITQGEIPLSRGQKRKFAKYRPLLQTLTTKEHTLQQKQRHIQTGGAAILAAVLPALLSAVVSAVGTSLFSK